MKAIKITPSRRRFFIFFLIIGILITGVSLFFLNVENNELDQYDLITYNESIPMPVFSVPEGIYDQPFELEIRAPDDYIVFYTTDGSIPTVRSKKYKKAITIDPHKNLNKNILSIATSLLWFPSQGQQNHSVPVRARCFKNNVGYGKVKNVIYHNPTIKQHAGFQAVHILIDADSLFSQERGIYVLGEKFYSNKTRVAADAFKVNNWHKISANYHERGKNWIRPAEFIFMDLSGKTLFEQTVNIALFGGISRALPQKSFKIMADSIRGDNYIHYPFFHDLQYNTYKNLILRGSSNDHNVIFRDILVQQIAKNAGINIQEYVPVVVYINGNYWGIHNIREKIDENYFAMRYGSCLDAIDILAYKGNKIELKYGQIQSLQSFDELINYITDNFFDDEKSYQYVCSQMDIDNFIDYMIVETFFANSDWPNNNVRSYRIRHQTDMMMDKNIEAGKWRWQIVDFDWSMDLSPSINMIERITENYTGHYITPMFLSLMGNAEFKEKFIKRYEFIIHHYFISDNMLRQFEYFEEKYQYEMERQIARWRRPILTHTWQKDLRHIKRFLRERPENVLEQLKQLEK